MPALASLDIGNNILASFSGSGLKALRHLYLNNNQLTSFDGTGLALIWTLNLENNTIISLPKVTGMKKIKSLSTTSNCLVRTRLDTSVSAWLDKYNTGGTTWEVQDETCSESFIVPTMNNITSATATITWNTDTASSSFVEYGLTATNR
jgi:Leucine-rich repeat (LRR) protein